MHTERGRGSHRVLALDIIDLDHALTLVRVTLAAGCHTRAAANTTRWIQKNPFDRL